MSGVRVIGELLLADSAVLAIAPAGQIAGGVLPRNTPLPALAVTSISGVDLQVLRRGSTRRVFERVQVTAFAANYQQQKDLLAAVRRACADKYGDFGGVTAVSVITDVMGPDFMIEGEDIWCQAQDFQVSFNEAA